MYLLMSTSGSPIIFNTLEYDSILNHLRQNAQFEEIGYENIETDTFMYFDYRINLRAYPLIYISEIVDL